MSKISRQKKKKKEAELERLGLLPTKHCECCNNAFLEKYLIVGPDPFNSEIHNDNTPVILCQDCHKDSCWSI